MKAYTRKNVRHLARAPHVHDFGRVHKVTNTQFRMGCTSCPAVDRWVKFNPFVANFVRTIGNTANKIAKQLSAALDGLLLPGTILAYDRTLLKHLKPFGGGAPIDHPAGWIVDADGFTPDEHPAARPVPDGWKPSGIINEPGIKILDDMSEVDMTVPGVTGPMGGIHHGETVPRAPKPHNPPVLFHKDSCTDMSCDSGCLYDEDPLFGDEQPEDDNKPVMSIGLEGATINGQGSIAVNKKGDVVYPDPDPDPDHPHNHIPDPPRPTVDSLMEMTKANLVKLARVSYELILPMRLNKRDMVDLILDRHDN